MVWSRFWLWSGVYALVDAIDRVIYFIRSIKFIKKKERERHITFCMYTIRNICCPNCFVVCLCVGITRRGRKWKRKNYCHVNCSVNLFVLWLIMFRFIEWEIARSFYVRYIFILCAMVMTVIENQTAAYRCIGTSAHTFIVFA